MSTDQKKRLLKECGVIYRNEGSPFVKLIEIYISEWKDELVNAKGDTVGELQGAIKRNQALLTEVKRADNEFPDRGKDGAYAGT